MPIKFATILIAAGASLLLAGCAPAPVKSRPGGGREDAAVRPNGETRDECRDAIRRARTDAHAGRYRLYVFGRDRYEPGFAHFLAEHLMSRYGIELVLSAPGDPARSQCYSNEMDKIIFNTFGPGILADAEQEARELFDSRK